MSSKPKKFSRITQPNFIISIFIILAGLLVFTYCVSLFARFTMDDSYITYRYAVNLANGNGLVFNPGEDVRAEGLTSPLWAVMLSLCPLSGLDIVITSKVIGVVSTLLTAILIWFSVFYTIKLLISYKPEKYGILSSSAVLFSSVAFFIFLIDPYTAGNAVSGMETAFSVLCYSLFLFFSLKMFAGKYHRLDSLITVILALFSCLLRPELIISIVAVFLLCIFLGRGKRRAVIISFVSFLILGTLYFLFRYNYYDSFFPLPFYVKLVNPEIEFGLRTILHFLLKWSLASPLLILFLVWLFRNRKFHLLSILTIALVIQFIYWIFPTPIMGFGYRYFQPLVPVMVVLTIIGSVILYNLLLKKIRQKYSFVLAIVLIIPLIIYRFTQIPVANGLYMTWYSSGMDKMINIGKTLKTLDSFPGPCIAVHDCGVIPYYSGSKTVDLAGLNNRNIALNLSPEGVLNELKSKRPDLVMIGSHDPYKFDILFPNEGLFYEQYRALGYKYIGTAETFADYYYRFYTRDTALSSKLKNALTKSCFLYDTEE